MTTALDQAMADPKALSSAMGLKGEEGSEPTPQSPGVVSLETGKSASDGVKISTDGLSAEEIALISPKPKGPEPKTEQPSTIAGTPYVTVEALAEGHKNMQRENQRLRDSIKKEQKGLIAAGVKEEIEKILAQAPPPVYQESDEEKALHKDDPESYRVLQLEKQVKSQNENFHRILSEIQGIKQGEQIRGIQSEFSKVAKAENVPLNALLAYGSLKQYANTPPEELVKIVKSELNLDKPAPIVTTPDPTEGVRSPSSGGTSAVSTEAFNVEDLGELGSKKWKQTEKKLKAIFLNRTRGGGS